MKDIPVHDPVFPELPMPGSDYVPPVGTPPFPASEPHPDDLWEDDPDYDRFEKTGRVTDYLFYKNHASLYGGGSPFDHQDPRHRFGTDAAQFPGQNTDPAHF